MNEQLKYPWRIDTNDRYRELVALLIGLSTAALLLPVFFVREFLRNADGRPLIEILPSTTYWSWILLGIAILSGIVFNFFSAKWVRLAWEQPVTVLWCSASEKIVERVLEWSLWLCILGFLGGVALTLLSLVSHAAGVPVAP